MIERTAHLRALTAPLRQFPVVAILGPRQIGKTTLARQLMSRRGTRRLGFEFKRTVAPTVTPSMRTALRDLHMDSLVVVHAGSHSYRLSRNILAIPLNRILEDVSPLR